MLHGGAFNTQSTGTRKHGECVESGYKFWATYQQLRTLNPHSVSKRNEYSKNKMTTFIPLHANPAVFTEMIRHLGVKDEIDFEDLPTLVDAEASPRPVLAVVAFLLPGDEEGVVDIVQYPFAEECACDDGQSYGPYDEGDSDCDTDYDPVVSFRQYIPTACSMYAAVHAVLNSCPSRVFSG